MSSWEFWNLVQLSMKRATQAQSCWPCSTSDKGNIQQLLKMDFVKQHNNSFIYIPIFKHLVFGWRMIHA